MSQQLAGSATESQPAAARSKAPRDPTQPKSSFRPPRRSPPIWRSMPQRRGPNPLSARRALSYLQKSILTF